MSNITVYSKPNCMQCEFTKKWLHNHGLPYTAIDVRQDELSLDYIKRLGYQNLPVVVVDDFEQYTYLMKRLEERGWIWNNRNLPTEWTPRIVVDVTKEPVYIVGNTGYKCISFSESLESIGLAVDVIRVKIPKADKVDEEEKIESDVIQPGHYNQGDMDLFEIFYHQYPFNEFRTGMRMIAARYYHRYPDKNGLEDYDKGDEVMRRLREYEEREKYGR